MYRLATIHFCHRQTFRRQTDRWQYDDYSRSDSESSCGLLSKSTIAIYYCNSLT